jgi:hypothetical protein
VDVVGGCDAGRVEVVVRLLGIGEAVVIVVFVMFV